jgi:aminobenzoyl-glutamate utilization protein A
MTVTETGTLKITDRTRLHDTLVQHRRDLHRHAEVRWTEFRTTSIVASWLTSLGYEVHLGRDTTTGAGAVARPDEEALRRHMERAAVQGASAEILDRTEGYTGVIGELGSGRDGPTIAFRFDMDALAGEEADGDGHLPAREGFRSVNEGCVHACGHDGHTAIGMALAQQLVENRAELVGRVRLIFQPSEEGGGGARGIVDRGWLDDVDSFFAIHLALAHEGRPMRSGELGAGSVDFLDSRRFDVRYTGRAAHPCGDPHNGRNALVAACGACLGIHAIPPHGEGLLRVNVGRLSAGVSRNTIAPNARFELEVRGESARIADHAQRRVMRIVEGAAAAHGVECEITPAGNTPAGRSDGASIAVVKQAAGQVAWFETVHDHGQVGGSDDATEMMNRVQSRGGKAAYIGVGADLAGGLHAADFDFDERAMAATVELLLGVTERIFAP